MQKEGRKFEKKKGKQQQQLQQQQQLTIFKGGLRGYNIFNMQTWRQNARNSFWLSPRHSPLALINWYAYLQQINNTPPPNPPPPRSELFYLVFLLPVLINRCCNWQIRVSVTKLSCCCCLLFSVAGYEIAYCVLGLLYHIQDMSASYEKLTLFITV